MLRPPVPAVDIHTHLFPARLSAAVRRALHSMYGWEFDITDEPAAFAAYIRARGTERFVVLPYAHKPAMARDLNAWVAATCSGLEGAMGFACVHPDDDAVDVLDHAFGAGLLGLKLHHQVQMTAPDDPRWDPVYRYMADHDRPLLVHAGRGPTDSGTVGSASFAAMMERFPTLRICVAHMGAPEISEFVALLDRYPGMMLDTSGLSDLSLAGVGIETHLDRIMFGTDAPNIFGTYDQAITRVTDLALGAEAERMIFRDNALRFLGIPEDSAAAVRSQHPRSQHPGGT